jgi:hypothetical protein
VDAGKARAGALGGSKHLRTGHDARYVRRPDAGGERSGRVSYLPPPHSLPAGSPAAWAGGGGLPRGFPTVSTRGQGAAQRGQELRGKQDQCAGGRSCPYSRSLAPCSACLQRRCARSAGSWEDGGAELGVGPHGRPTSGVTAKGRFQSLIAVLDEAPSRASSCRQDQPGIPRFRGGIHYEEMP